MKKILLLLILTTLIGCGFKPIYSSKESDFKIIKIETDQNLLNRKFAKKLESSSNEESNNRISVKFNIKKEKLIKVKNKKNIPTIFELKINLILTITDQENNERTEELTVRTKYNNKDDNKYLQNKNFFDDEYKSLKLLNFIQSNFKDNLVI